MNKKSTRRSTSERTPPQNNSGLRSAIQNWLHRYIYKLLFVGVALCTLGTVLLASLLGSHSSSNPQWNTLERLLHGYVHKVQIASNVHGPFIPKPPTSKLDLKSKPPETKKANNKPLNILLLYADDWRHDSLGVAGNPFVKTPFLDQLARNRGVRFTHNCVTTSICWLSRATLHTGLYASRNKGYMPEKPYWYQQWYKSFPYLMTTYQNYAVAHVGKWDYQFFHDIPAIFQTYVYSRIYQNQHWYTPAEVEAEVLQQTQTTGQPLYNDTATTKKYKTSIRKENEDEPEQYDDANDGQRQQQQQQQQEQVHVIDRTLHDSLQFLEHRPKDQPFMLTVAFFPPHAVDGTEEQFFPQPETAVCYENNAPHLPSHPVPPSFMNASWDRLPQSIFKEDNNEARKRWHQRFDGIFKYSQMMINYYRLITGIDTACKTLVEELERQGILDETLIIFTTDNGYYLGEHGLAGKWFPHEESIRVPLIIVDPRAPASARGTVNDEFTLNLDLAPTILGASQSPIPAQMQGRDISELYLNEGNDNREHEQHNGEQQMEPWREEFYYEHPQFWDDSFLPASTALVRKSHKYIQWGGGSVEARVEQLFDLEVDPKEEHDVSHDSRYAVIFQEMKQRHEELRQNCCVPLPETSRG